MNGLATWLALFLACGIGGVCRAGIQFAGTLWFPDVWRGGATFLANVLACFFAGVVAAWPGLNGNLRWILLTGFCGGFSTFSAFALDHWHLWKTETLWALATMLLQLIAGLAAAWFGLWLGRQA